VDICKGVLSSSFCCQKVKTKRIISIITRIEIIIIEIRLDDLLAFFFEAGSLGITCLSEFHFEAQKKSQSILQF
jgi:hypothetical protein